MRTFLGICWSVSLGATLTCCNPRDEQPKVTSHTYGTLSDGREVEAFWLDNGTMQVEVITFGGIITRLFTPDKTGALDDVVLGFDTLQKYENKSPYFGAIVGRYANRIAGAEFSLGEDTFNLAQNDGMNTLHGGEVGFDKRLWQAEKVSSDTAAGVKLTYESPDGEEGYPGKLTVEVAYLLKADNSLQIDYRATTDQETVVNLSQHSYFNLSGGRENILDHRLSLHADYYLPVDSTLIPTGEFRPVKGTPFDFRDGKKIGKDINMDNAQLIRAGGYDHNWVLDKEDHGQLKKAAEAYHEASGRKLEVFTTDPGIQFYSGNFLDGSLIGKRGQVYEHRDGFCLESQHFPDSPNQPEFPGTTLAPGEKYKKTTLLKFSVE